MAVMSAYARVWSEMKPEGKIQPALDWVNCMKSGLSVRICDCVYAWIRDC